MPTAVKKVAAKKVAKTAAKKAAVTKKAQKTVAKPALVYAADAHSFWVHDGQILNSLKALHEALLTMEKAVYGHHVTKEKHDFADWVESVLKDDACANALRKAKTAPSAASVVAKYLRAYSF